METVPCEWCGDNVERHPYQLEKDKKHFCSRECQTEWQTVERTGSNAAAWKGGKKTVTCDECGEEYSDYPSRIERTDHTFCSSECAGAYQQITGAGECDWCGESFDQLPSQLDRAEHNFCSKDCRAAWMSEQNSGHRSSLWKGGVSGHPRNYGPNWDEQRQKCIDRDGSCILCDSKSDLVVHHKRPLRNFDRESPGWWHLANGLDNLVTLCRSCHSKVHAHESEHLGDLIG